MQTLSEIRARILHRTHITTAQFSLTNSASDGQSILNSIIAERASLIQGTASFSWATKVWAFNSTPAVVGQTDPTFYPLPTNFKHELSVVDVLEPYPLAPIGWIDYKILEPTIRSVDVPRYYTYPPGGATIAFYPDLGAGRTINISYATMPFALYDDLSKPDVPGRVSEVYFRALLEGCCMDVYRYLPNQDEKAELCKTYYDQAVKDLIKASKMHGLLVTVLEPQEMTSGLPRAQLPSEYPIV